MGFFKRGMARLARRNQEFVPILNQQAGFLVRTSSMLVEMFESSDKQLRASLEKEIKSSEAQGDALMTEFHSMLTGRRVILLNKYDLQTVSMAFDDCLDVIKDTAKAVLIYNPEHLDEQLCELARMTKEQSLIIQEMIPLLADIKENLSSIRVACDRVTELEHEADDAYEEYIGYIFENVDDTRELIKYKNLAEMLENATDAHKHITDCVRKLLLNFFSE